MLGKVIASVAVMLAATLSPASAHASNPTPTTANTATTTSTNSINGTRCNYKGGFTLCIDRDGSDIKVRPTMGSRSEIGDIPEFELASKLELQIIETRPSPVGPITSTYTQYKVPFWLDHSYPEAEWLCREDAIAVYAKVRIEVLFTKWQDVVTMDADC